MLESSPATDTNNTSAAAPSESNTAAASALSDSSTYLPSHPSEIPTASDSSTQATVAAERSSSPADNGSNAPEQRAATDSEPAASPSVASSSAPPSTAAASEADACRELQAIQDQADGSGTASATASAGTTDSQDAADRDGSDNGDDEEDDWEKKDEAELTNIESNKAASSTDDEQRPWANGSTGSKLMYHRDFLLQFQPRCKAPPKDLPPIAEILAYDNASSGGGGGGGGGRGGGGGGSGGPSDSWAKGSRGSTERLNLSGSGGGGGGRSNSRGGGGGGGSMAGPAGGGARGARPGSPGLNQPPVKGGRPPGLATSGGGGPRGYGASGPAGAGLIPAPMYPGGGGAGTGGFPLNSSGGIGGKKPKEPKLVLPRGKDRWERPKIIKDESDLVLRKTTGLLNKITLETFASISDQFLNLPITNAELLRGVIRLVFEKAVSEPHFAAMYSDLCKKLAEKFPSFGEASDKQVCIRCSGVHGT